MSKESPIPVTDEEAEGADVRPESAETDEAPTAEAESPVEGGSEAAPEASPEDEVAEAAEPPSPEQARIDELEGEMLRLRAEMENLRRRSAREVENAHKYGVERLVGELLPIKDSMELGLKAAGEPGVEVERVRDGLELTIKLLSDALAKFGLEEVDPAGQPFDPQFHEAMTLAPSADAAPDSVLEVFQKGYVLSGRLVRPAKVVVARAPDA